MTDTSRVYWHKWQPLGHVLPSYALTPDEPTHNTKPPHRRMLALVELAGYDRRSYKAAITGTIEHTSKVWQRFQFAGEACNWVMDRIATELGPHGRSLDYANLAILPPSTFKRKPKKGTPEYYALREIRHADNQTMRKQRSPVPRWVYED